MEYKEIDNKIYRIEKTEINKDFRMKIIDKQIKVLKDKLLFLEKEKINLSSVKLKRI